MIYRYFLQLSYKGTHYHGWQVQPNAVTVQETLTEALLTILREDLEVTGAGRTDTGVHASYFIAHFDSKQEDLHQDKKLLFKINGYLPKDIAINQIFKVKDDAHARFDAIERTYHYYIHQQKDPFINESSFYLSHNLDVELMNQACKLLYQFSDFTSFSKLHTDVKTNNCKIKNALWLQDVHKLTFTITADRFLRNMVRAIVGTLIELGKHKISLENFIQIIENKNRSEAGVSVPAHGLFLTNITYDHNIFVE